MDDFGKVEGVEIASTTLMKIVKHCRESGNDEALGVIMGAVTENSCFIGNCFPHHSKRSTVRHQETSVKTKRSIVDKAVEYFEQTNYDNNVCGIYINVPSGSIFSTEFINEILTSSNFDLLNDSKILIAYERSLADLGMNPLTAFKFSQNFIDNVKNDKIDEIMKSKISIEKLDIKIFRSSFDQAFLAEYVCPKVSETSNSANEDFTMTDIY